MVGVEIEANGLHFLVLQYYLKKGVSRTYLFVLQARQHVNRVSLVHTRPSQVIIDLSLRYSQSVPFIGKRRTKINNRVCFKGETKIVYEREMKLCWTRYDSIGRTRKGRTKQESVRTSLKRIFSGLIFDDACSLLKCLL